MHGSALVWLDPTPPVAVAARPAEVGDVQLITQRGAPRKKATIERRRHAFARQENKFVFHKLNTKA